MAEDIPLELPIKKAPNSDVLAGTIVILANAAVLAPMLMPQLFDVRNTEFEKGTAMYSAIRTGQVLASLILIGMGVFIANLTDDMLPFWLAVVTAGFMAAAYEIVYRQVPSTKGEING